MEMDPATSATLSGGVADLWSPSYTTCLSCVLAVAKTPVPGGRTRLSLQSYVSHVKCILLI